MKNSVMIVAVKVGILCPFLVTFTASAQTTFDVPAEWAFAAGTGDAGAPGFFGRMHQARKNSNLTATIARGNAQLDGLLIDPETSAPYQNLAVMIGDEIIDNGWTGTLALEADGSFILPGFINSYTDGDGFLADNGSFDSFNGFEEQFFPGMPGSEAAVGDFFTNGQNFAVEYVAWLDLPAGEIILGVHHSDAVEVAMHPNDPRDIFRQQIVGFDSNAGQSDREVTLTIAEAGLYPIRVLLAHWNGATALEFFSAPVSNPGARVLINDIGTAGAVPTYRALTVPTRPYVTAVSPLPGASGVLPGSSVVVMMRNAAVETPVMEVNGLPVTFAKETTGEVTTLTYKPSAPFATGSAVTVGLAYGLTSEEWSFNVLSGRKAILITGGGTLNSGDAWISQRLSSQFGFDVSVISDAAVSVDDAEDADLIYNSATVISGNVADEDFELLEVPLINAEGANTDDFRLIDAPYAGQNGNNPAGGITGIVIDDNTHPITRGLELGSLPMFTANVQTHWGAKPVNGVSLASTPGDEFKSLLFLIEAGLTVNDTDDTPFAHPARRVHFGMGNDGAGLFTDAGTALFDKVVEWALGKSLPDSPPVITSVGRDAATGNISITWTSVPDLRYVIETSNSGMMAWDGDLSDDYLATGETSTIIDNDAASYPQRFYRVRLQE